MKLLDKKLTALQLYRKLRKEGHKMTQATLEREIAERCHEPIYKVMGIVKPWKGRRASGNWESGHKGPRKYQFTTMRQTLLLVLAGELGEL